MAGALRLWIDVAKRLREVWGEVLTVHLAYTALQVVLIAPGIGLMGQLLLGFSGQKALVDQDIAAFVLTPVGFPAAVFFGALLLVTLAFEQASLMAVGMAAASGCRMTTLDAIVFAARRTPATLELAVRLVVRSLLLVLPFVAVAGASALFLISDHDINYYLSETPPEFFTTLVIAGVAGSFMLFILASNLLAWSLSLPLVLFAGVRPAAALAESRLRVAGHRRRVLVVFVIWMVAAAVFAALPLFVMDIAGSWAVPRFDASLGGLVIALGGVAVLWAFGNLLVTAFSAGAFAFGVLDLFRTYGPDFEPTSFGSDALLPRRLRVTPARFAAAVGAAALLALGTGAWLLHGIQTEDAVVVIAHRGAAGKAPENTLAAVRQAIEDGADFIEIDVQETADGEVVVMHDSDFMKLSGEPLKIWDATLEQVRSLDVGSWFAPEFASERVPTLREVLLAARGAVRVLIELKYYGHDEQLEQRVIDIVEATGMTDQVQLMSLKYPAVQKVHALRPDWMVGLLAATAIGDLVRLEADFLAVNATIAKRSLIRAARVAGKPLYVWTLNDPVSMSRMISLGADGIITDEPAIARDVLAARAEMSSIERLLLHAAILFDRPLEDRVGRAGPVTREHEGGGRGAADARSAIDRPRQQG